MYQGKGSGPDVLSAYRKRQERFQKLQFLIWGIAALLVVGGGVLLFFQFRPDDPRLTTVITETPDTAANEANEAVEEEEPISPPPTPSQFPDSTDTPAATPLPTEPSVITHTVQAGETLAGIAAAFGVDLSALMAANPLVTPEFINIGDELTIPAGSAAVTTATAPAGGGAATGAPAGVGATGTAPAAASGDVIEYVVVAGDTLASIATNYGVTIDVIVQENGLASADQIQEGQTLRIPITGSAATPAGAGSSTPTTGVTVTPTP